MKNFKVILYLLSIIVILVGCNKNNNSSDKIVITTSVNFYAEIANSIAKDKATINSIITNSSVDPHDFEPTADDAKKVADSNIVIFNGGGYDFWFEKLTENNNNLVKIDAANLINLKKGENEHIWYNPKVLENVANKLTEELIKKDSKNKDFYEKNKAEYIKNLNNVNEKINSLKEKADGKIVLTTEPVFDYAVKSLNLKTTDEIDKLAKATSEGNDPAPQILKQIQEDIKNKKINLIINNTQTTNKAIESIIKLSIEYNIPILNVSETQPNNKTYIEWMLDQYNELEKILDGGKGEEAYHNKEAKDSHSHNHDHEHDHNH